MSAFPADWGAEYIDADRIERRRRELMRPDRQTGFPAAVYDHFYDDEPEDEELSGLTE